MTLRENLGLSQRLLILGILTTLALMAGGGYLLRDRLHNTILRSMAATLNERADRLASSLRAGDSGHIYHDPALAPEEYRTIFSGWYWQLDDGQNHKHSRSLWDSSLNPETATRISRDTLNEREQLCEKVEIIPLEVIVRNVIAGSMAARLGFEEGSETEYPIFEICYKNDALGDPLINDDHAVALGIASYEDLDRIYELTDQINATLFDIFDECDVLLVDFKIEFGRTADGEIVLADEISPDSCRLWDADTLEKLDKDRFRRDMGGLLEAYQDILDRLEEREENDA